MIKYEDFTQHPDREFAEICEFLMEPYESQAVKEEAPYFGRWQGDPHLWGEIVPVTKNWRDYIEPEEADVIQITLSGVMDRLGYEPYRLL